MQLIKYLQAQGLGSRKQCQQFIKNGAVAINGTILAPTYSEIDPDTVKTLSIDGEEIVVMPQPFYYILLNKPPHYETSHKPRDYPSVFSLLPDNIRATTPQAIGRLDADTTGVLLITNDGQFNHKMTSPKHQITKLYQVTLKHPADKTLCKILTNGVLLHDENETVHAHDASLSDSHTLLLSITEGKYHQVKRMVSAAGNRVEQLHRLKFAQWDTQDLAMGQWRFIQI